MELKIICPSQSSPSTVQPYRTGPRNLYTFTLSSILGGIFTWGLNHDIVDEVYIDPCEKNLDQISITHVM